VPACLERSRSRSGNPHERRLPAVCIGNPNLRDCAFFDCFNKDRELWHTFTMNAEDSEIVSKENIERIAEEFGRDSDVFRVRVLGEFPEQDPNTVMNPDDLEACSNTDALKFSQTGNQKQFGLDLARFGSERGGVATQRQRHHRLQVFVQK
jgi:hypothetical protein